MPEPIINQQEWDLSWRRGYSAGPPLFGQKVLEAVQRLEIHYTQMAHAALRDAATLQGYVDALHDRITGCQ